MDFLVLEEDKQLAKQLYTAILDKRREVIEQNILALHHQMNGEYIEVASCDFKAATAQQELNKAYRDMQELYNKRATYVREHSKRVNVVGFMLKVGE